MPLRFALTPEEAHGLEYLPDKDLADWAVELDMVPEEEIDRLALVEELVPRLMSLAQQEGLPFSKYDAQDLSELPPNHREALARAMGWRPDVRSMIRAGERVWRVYRKNRLGSQVPIMLPILLRPLARFAHDNIPG